MANKIFNYRYRASASAASYGTANFNVLDVASYGIISSLVNTTPGYQQRFAYNITTANQAGVYEYGIGYLTSLGGGLYQFARETSLSSSQGDNSKINIQSAYGEITIDLIEPNSNYSNYKRINSSSTLDPVNSTYFVDAAGNLTLSLPAIATDAVIIGLIITSLNGEENERANAVTLDADGTNTIANAGTYVLSKRNNYIRIISDVENSNWIVLDPISETASSSGPDGAVQLADDGILGYSTGLFYQNDVLWIGGSGNNNAAVKISSLGSAFNIQSGNIDFAINGSSQGNTFFVDASTNRIGVRTNTPSDILDINVTDVGGITVGTSSDGVIPTIKILNNDPLFTQGIDIGRIDFIGLNDIAENVIYSRLISEAFDATEGSEEGLVKLQVNNNSILQTIAILSYNDIQIGPNNSISGGIIVGANNTNKGDNVCLGYYNDNCGTSSITIGNQNIVQSGAYACVVGTEHTVTGSYLWVFGGSGAEINDVNSTYLLVDNNNYIKLKNDQQQRIGIYADSLGTNFNIVNTRISLTGTEHSQGFVFTNSAGVQVTGVSYGISILDPEASSEDTKFFVKVLKNGSSADILSMSANNVNISNASGFDNSVLIGSNLEIVGDGPNITIIGLSNTISNNSGENTVVGYNNEFTTSGNEHIIVVGNSNTVDENYSTTVGSSNENSGLYSSVVGYNNGIYGENISIVGANNSVAGNNSSIIGYQNNIENIGVYVIGQGNISAYSGVHILGNDVTATGHNITYIKNKTVVITGDYITFNTAGTVNFNGTTTLDGSVLASSGDDVSIFVNDKNYLESGVSSVSHLINDAGYLTTDAYVTGINYNGAGRLVLSTHSGSVTGILTGAAHTGNNVSIFINDAGYITANDYANPKLTFNLTNSSALEIRFSGAGTNNDNTPDIYVYIRI